MAFSQLAYQFWKHTFAKDTFVVRCPVCDPVTIRHPPSVRSFSIASFIEWRFYLFGTGKENLVKHFPITSSSSCICSLIAKMKMKILVLESSQLHMLMNIKELGEVEMFLRCWSRTCVYCVLGTHPHFFCFFNKNIDVKSTLLIIILEDKIFSSRWIASFSFLVYVHTKISIHGGKWRRKSFIHACNTFAPWFLLLSSSFIPMYFLCLSFLFLLVALYSGHKQVCVWMTMNVCVLLLLNEWMKARTLNKITTWPISPWLLFQQNWLWSWASSSLLRPLPICYIRCSILYQECMLSPLAANVITTQVGHKVLPTNTHIYCTISPVWSARTCVREWRK